MKQEERCSCSHVVSTSYLSIKLHLTSVNELCKLKIYLNAIPEGEFWWFFNFLPDHSSSLPRSCQFRCHLQCIKVVVSGNVTEMYITPWKSGRGCNFLNLQEYLFTRLATESCRFNFMQRFPGVGRTFFENKGANKDSWRHSLAQIDVHLLVQILMWLILVLSLRLY